MCGSTRCSERCSDEDVLIRCYTIVGVAVDQLPYSNDLDRIANLYKQDTGSYIGSASAFRELFNLRKSGRLKKIQEISPLDQLWLSAGRIPARFRKLWIVEGSTIYKGVTTEPSMKVTLVRGEPIGTMECDAAAERIVKEHNEALIDTWVAADLGTLT